MNNPNDAAPAHILWDVVQEHFDEAEFLLEQWEAALASPIYTIDEVLEGPEERLEAHLDGLRVAGPPILARLVQPVLEDQDAEYATLVVALLSQLDLDASTSALETAAALLRDSNDLRRSAAFRAFTLSQRGDIDDWLRTMISRTSAEGRSAAVRLLALRGSRVQPEAIVRCLRSETIEEVRAGLEAAYLTGTTSALPLVEHYVYARLPELQALALRAGAVLGLRRVWSLCPEWLDHEEVSWHAMELMALSDDARLIDQILPLLENVSTRKAALWSLGFGGRPEAVDASISLLDNDDVQVAKLAGELFFAITGVDPEEQEEFIVEVDEPGEDETLPPLDDDDLDADLSLDSLEDLPLPNAAACREFWHRRRDGFRTGQRYLAGDAIVRERLAGVLPTLSTRRRQLAGLEIAIISNGREIVPTWQWARSQPYRLRR